MAITMAAEREAVWFALEAIEAELEVEPSPGRLNLIRHLQAGIARAAIDPDPTVLPAEMDNLFGGLGIDLGLYIGKWPQGLTLTTWNIIRRSNRWLEMVVAGGDTLNKYLNRAHRLEQRRGESRPAMGLGRAQEARGLWWATGRKAGRPTIAERQKRRLGLAVIERLRSTTKNSKYRAIVDAILVERIYLPREIIRAKCLKWSDWQGFQRMAQRMALRMSSAEA